MAEATGFDSRWLYTVLIGAVALERGAELLLARRNARRLRRRGAVEAGAAHYPWMVGFHAVFLACCAAEVWLLARPSWAPLAAAMLLLLAAAIGLRLWVIATLGERWTTRVLVLSGVPAVDRGPYRWLRHPNYLAVVLEVLALPLVHGAWLTALAGSAGNAALLAVRIRAEESALAAASDYEVRLGRRGRFLPRRRAR